MKKINIKRIIASGLSLLTMATCLSAGSVAYAEDLVAIDETNRRRAIQSEYNKIHHITPTTIIKPVKNTLEITKKESSKPKVDKKDIPNEINKLTALMKIASDSLDFEQAIILRNQIAQLKKDIDKKD